MSDKRKPSDLELEVLSVLLKQDFPGAAELRKQVPGIEVAQVDDDGSLSLHPRTGSALAHVIRRVPIEGHYADSDGERVHVLLHVVDGYLNELELFREDGEVVMRQLPSGVSEFLVDLW